MTKKVDPSALLASCFEAFDAAAREAFARDGSVDCGSCGGTMLGYRGNTRFAKALAASGRSCSIDGKVYVASKLPEGVNTQGAHVEDAAMRAFRLVASAAGIEPSKVWSYVD